jgi:hypothetical protein
MKLDKVNEGRGLSSPSSSRPFCPIPLLAKLPRPPLLLSLTRRDRCAAQVPFKAFSASRTRASPRPNPTPTRPRRGRAPSRLQLGSQVPARPNPSAGHSRGHSRDRSRDHSRDHSRGASGPDIQAPLASFCSS